MADYTPLFRPGDDVTYTASAAITGGQLVEITGTRSVGPAGAASTKYVGVALFDAAAGDSVTIEAGGVQRPTASGAIAAGDRVQAAANGAVATGTTAPLGTAIAAAADGAVALIKFDR
jgi:predicted RecA/RadA family phage recombinase